MRKLALLVAMAIGLTIPPALAEEEEVSGYAKVVSGDTIRIGKRVVRFFGLDSIEPKQPCENAYGKPIACANLAKRAVRAIIKRRRVACFGYEKDEKGALIGICYAGDMLLNAAIVRQGWGLVNPDGALDYIEIEKKAKQEQRGLWPYRFVKPWIWREQQMVQD